jgi:hypothetical protein
MMRPRQSSLHALRSMTIAALIGTTIALGSLHDALIYAPNGADVDSGTTASTASKQR